MNSTPPRQTAASPSSNSLSPDSQTNGDPSLAQQQHGPRRSSFNFLRRQKSSEKGLGNRSVSGSKMLKKQKAQGAHEELLRQQREAAQVPRQAPRLPNSTPLNPIPTFGGEDHRPDSVAIVSNRVGSYAQGGSFSRPSVDYKMSSSPAQRFDQKVAAPPIPNTSPYGKPPDFDPYARTESMTHRGRYSYASSAVSTVNSPRRVRRRKDPTPFNVLVMGTKNCGKTSFIDFLRTSLALPSKKRVKTPTPPTTALHNDLPFTSHYTETEIDHERIGVTLWDSQGLESNIVDLQLREMSSFLESKFEDTFTEEQKVVRSPGVQDTHIHCVFLILDPGRLDTNIAAAKKSSSLPPVKGEKAPTGVLDESLDLQVLRTLQGKTTVIPVISKADTITTAHMNYLKRAVWESLKAAKLDPLEALSLEESDEEDEDRLDERDEDLAVASSSDNEDNENVINNLVDRSSDEDQNDDTELTADESPLPADKSPLAVKNGRESASSKHKRRTSAMSASLSPTSNSTETANEVPYLPVSIISPDIYEPGVVGRRFPWGFADPYNTEHCDFGRLKDSVFGEWRAELREASRERWYEEWRASRLKRRVGTPLKGSTINNQQRMNGSAPRSVSGRIGSPGDQAKHVYRSAQ